MFWWVVKTKGNLDWLFVFFLLEHKEEANFRLAVCVCVCVCSCWVVRKWGNIRLAVYVMVDCKEEGESYVYWSVHHLDN